jgi:hypothetical protein
LDRSADLVYDYRQYMVCYGKYDQEEVVIQKRVN